MTSTLIDSTNFSSFSVFDTSSYTSAYLTTVFNVAHQTCTNYLGYNPAVQVHANEQGEARLVHSGREGYQMVFRMKHRPFISTTATANFTALSLLFPAPFPALDLLAATGPLGALVTRQASAMVYTPFLGLGQLPAIMFQYGGGSSPTMGPTGYQATYTAGYAITSADITAFPTALPVPASMQQACTWIIEAMLAQAGRIQADPQTAVAGSMAGFKNMDYEERYQREADNPDAIGQGRSILYGTQQGIWAREALDPYRRSPAERILFI